MLLVSKRKGERDRIRLTFVSPASATGNKIKPCDLSPLRLDEPQDVQLHRMALFRGHVHGSRQSTVLQFEIKLTDRAGPVLVERDAVHQMPCSDSRFQALWKSPVCECAGLVFEDPESVHCDSFWQELIEPGYAAASSLAEM